MSNFKPRDEPLRARDSDRRVQPDESEPSTELVDGPFAHQRPAASHRPAHPAYGLYYSAVLSCTRAYCAAAGTATVTAVVVRQTQTGPGSTVFALTDLSWC